MAETTWTEEGPGIPKKKGIPTWLWFCGGGCLLAVLVAVVGIALVFPMIAKMKDPKVQWERLAHILPYDEQPPELTPTMGFGVGFGASMEQVQLQDSRGFMITVQSQEGVKAAEGRRKMFASDKPEFPKDVGVMQFDHVEPGAVEVQGRNLHVLRMHMEFPAWMKGLVGKRGGEELGKFGSMAFVDVTPEGKDGMVLLEMMKVSGPDPVSDEEIRTFLKPFRVGPNH